MKEKIESIVNNIFHSLKTHPPLSLSLLDGETSCCLFTEYYIKYSKNKEAFRGFQKSIRKLADNSIGFGFPTFCGGKAGINWFFTDLYKNDILDKDVLQVFCDDVPELVNEAIAHLQIGMYDFLHGAIGIFYYFLYAGVEGVENYCQMFFSIFRDLNYDEKNKLFIADYDLLKNKPKKDKVNFGLAHGLPSILKFCLQCYNQNICSQQAKVLAFDIIVFLRSNANKNHQTNYFPNYVGAEISEYSRLGWCYGDLGVAYILYQAGLTFEDQELQNFAVEVLKHSTKRRTYEETMVKDAGICHGSAGIAHVFNRMWHYTHDDVFKEACDFWIKKTIDYAVYDDGIAGYKCYSPSEEKYVNSYGLLLGVSGVGLALLSYLTGDFSWDYCLMLNN